VTDPPGDRDRELSEERRQARRQGLAYQGAFEAVIAILVAAGIGLWIDQRFGTSPIGLLVGTAVGFASFVLRLLRLGRQLQAGGQEGAGGGTDDGRES
jgi:F0F1-type ATP synthase assembly protein I